MCVELDVSNPNISGVINRNVAKKEPISCQMCSIGHMTFVFKLDHAIEKVTM